MLLRGLSQKCQLSRLSHRGRLLRGKDAQGLLFFSQGNLVRVHSVVEQNLF